MIEKIIIFLIFVLMPIFTFGHAASHTHDCRDFKLDKAACTVTDKISNGIIPSLAWPLYWSWVLWEMTMEKPKLPEKLPGGINREEKL